MLSSTYSSSELLTECPGLWRLTTTSFPKSPVLFCVHLCEHLNMYFFCNDFVLRCCVWIFSHKDRQKKDQFNARWWKAYLWIECCICEHNICDVYLVCCMFEMYTTLRISVFCHWWKTAHTVSWCIEKLTGLNNYCCTIVSAWEKFDYVGIRVCVEGYFASNLGCLIVPLLKQKNREEERQQASHWIRNHNHHHKQSHAWHEQS